MPENEGPSPEVSHWVGAVRGEVSAKAHGLKQRTSRWMLV